VKQHFIPKFVVEGFVDDEAGGNRGVWVYHDQHRRWAKRPTKRIASLDDFYSLVEPTGEREDTLEMLFHSIETPAAMLLRKDLATHRPIVGSPQWNDLFVTFCAILIARNPATIELARDVLVQQAHEIVTEITESAAAFRQFREQFQAETGEEFPNIIEFERLRTDFKISATKAGGLGASIRTVTTFAVKLAAMDIDFVTAPQGLSFITADIPFIIIGRDDVPAEFDQVIVPLSASMTAIFNASDEPQYSYVDASEADVRAVNRAMLFSARNLIISRSRDVFDGALLDSWATADSTRRREISYELMQQETGT
jgi:hypothetical protein